jgi:Bacterial SH3 domain
MTDTLSTSTVTDLLASSKAKLAMAQSRMRRSEPELALLSLHGSIEDALRAHLLRYRLPAGAAVWGAMLDAARSDERQPLSIVEYERIQRLHTIRSKIARGDEVTITRDTIGNYYDLATRLLPRYGVQTLLDEEADIDEPPSQRAAARTRPLRLGEGQRRDPALDVRAPRRRLALDEDEPPEGWRRYQSIIFPALLIVSIFFIGVSISIGLNQSRQENTPFPTLPPATSISITEPITITTLVPATLGPTPDVQLLTPSPTAPLPNVVSLGRPANVRADVVGGLNVRAQPGTAPTIPILFSLAPNSLVDVIEGPVTADGLTWWKVRAANQEGWCAGEFLEAR